MGDARKVKGTRLIENGLRKIARLEPVEMRLDSETREFTPGFIAQKLFQVFPELVRRKSTDNGTDPLPPNASGFVGWQVERLDLLVPYVVAAIIELKVLAEEIDTVVKRRTRAVDRRLDDLESRVAALENPSSGT